MKLTNQGPTPETLYVGCCLTGAPDAFVDQVEGLKDVLKNDYDVYDFVGLTAGTSEDVYRWDIEHCVAESDMFIAVCDYPSIGLGWETCESINLGKPTLGVAHKESRITRLVLGAAGVKPHFTFKRYEDLKVDVPKLILPTFQAHIRSQLLRTS